MTPTWAELLMACLIVGLIGGAVLRARREIERESYKRDDPEPR